MPLKSTEDTNNRLIDQDCTGIREAHSELRAYCLPYKYFMSIQLDRLLAQLDRGADLGNRRLHLVDAYCGR